MFLLTFIAFRSFKVILFRKELKAPGISDDDNDNSILDCFDSQKMVKLFSSLLHSQ